MSALVALLGLAVVHVLAVASPGPSTVLVVHADGPEGRARLDATYAAERATARFPSR